MKVASFNASSAKGVHLVIETTTEATDDDDPTGWKTAMALEGCIKGAPPDAAENHDKYLYGSPEE